jgi:hypothetical protein
MDEDEQSREKHKKSTSDPTSITHETHFHGQVTGPVHTGSGDIKIEKIVVNQDPSLETMLDTIRKSISTNAPQEIQTSALQRVNMLAQAVDEREPDLDLMESVLVWFQKHLPSFSPIVLTFIFLPAVEKVIRNAGESTLSEYQQRFHRLP